MNWLVYDRNPDFQGILAPVSNMWQPKYGLAENDVVLLAGTPEWFGAPLHRLFQAANTSKCRVLALGLGYPSNRLSLDALDVAVMKRARPLTARDINVVRILESHGVQATLAPCPSLFASRDAHMRRSVNRVGLVVQTSQPTNHSIAKQIVKQLPDLYKALQETAEVLVVCHYISEFSWARTQFENTVYADNSKDLLDVYRTCDVVVSTRLHGAIAAMAVGAPAVLINDDPRCVAAAMTIPAMLRSTTRCAPEVVATLDVQEQSRRILAYKARERDSLLALLKNAL